jgi:hypothetical protein
MRTKSEAAHAAKDLLSLMKTTGWKTNVWENNGYWYYNIWNGGMTVGTLFSTSGYFALLSADNQTPPCGGSEYWHDRASTFEDPNDAVNDTLKRAQNFRDRITGIISAQEKSLGLPVSPVIDLPGFLQSQFPWLDFNDSASGADVVQQLTALYEQAKVGK